MGSKILDKYKNYINNKTILVIGGIGSFGNAVAEKLLTVFKIIWKLKIIKN